MDFALFVCHSYGLYAIIFYIQYLLYSHCARALQEKIDISLSCRVHIILILLIHVYLHRFENDLLRCQDVDVQVVVCYPNNIIRIETTVCLIIVDDIVRRFLRWLRGRWWIRWHVNICQKFFNNWICFQVQGTSICIMLDFNCDALMDVFHYFLNNIWFYHWDYLFSLMENITILVLEESGDFFLSSQILQES